eukprot:Skav228543  [mRNA]  locus=scaffold1887:381124:382140:+ [translate_table: standard]
MAVSVAFGKRSIRVCCWLWLWILLRTCPCGFGRPRQQPLSELREQSGFAARAKAKGIDATKSPLNSKEMQLVKNIGMAAEDRDWPPAKSSFASYTGSATQVYAAAMRAAFRCRKYEDGAKIYEQCRANCKYVGSPAFSEALRIFAKMGKTENVKEIWDGALKATGCSEVLGAARIAAAADARDVEGAAATLDIMVTSTISINVYHITSAMRACWGWGNKQHKAARYFFSLLSKLKLSPNIVSFTCLIGAYHTASLQEVLGAYREMATLEIEPNAVFAETYLFTLFQVRKGMRVEDQLRGKSAERLQAAREALAAFKAAGVPLTRVCTDVYDELTRRSF